MLITDSSTFYISFTFIGQTVLIVKYQLFNVNVSAFVQRIAVERLDEDFLLIIPQRKRIIICNYSDPWLFRM